ncbi:MAG: hypothetical protein RMI99_05725 [Nitrososphaerota archaeon]|nr:hypothetical protein [Candidatus Nezhaarchaeota archaeon]MDW8050538.1 hypothetical protein [Nitrososphaerota archaeon]
MMKIENVICTGCSLLCDDVDVEVDGNVITKTWGACSHGNARFKGLNENRPKSALANGLEVDIDKSVELLIKKLRSAKKPLIYGGECSSNRVIELCLELAEKLNAVYDAPPSICRVMTPIQRSFEVKDLSFTEILNAADFILYWGASVADTHLRHASKYTVMPRGIAAKMGRESRIVAMIDVRESASMKIAQHKVVVEPCRDSELAKAIREALDGRAPSTSLEFARQVFLLVSDLKRAFFTAMFVGDSVLRCENYEESVKEIVKLAKRLCEEGICSLHPLAESLNSYGQAKVTYTKLGLCDPYDFKVKERTKSAYDLISRGSVDFVLAVNSDIVAQTSPQLAISLKGKLACTTELKSLTQYYSSIAIPVAALGIEAGGKVTRTDGVDVELRPFMKAREGLISEEELISRLINSV